MSREHLVVTDAPPVVLVVDAETVRVTEAAQTAVLTLDPEAVVVQDGATELLAIMPEGPPGVPGPTGPPGPSGQSYTHTQGVPAAIWTIPHGLGFRPGGIVVLDTLLRAVVGVPSYPDADTLVLTFSAAFSGTAHLS